MISSERDTRSAFERMNTLGTGSIRLELPDEWIALVHFSSREEITIGPIVHRYCDFVIYMCINGEVKRKAVRGNVVYDTFINWINQVTEEKYVQDLLHGY